METNYALKRKRTIWFKRLRVFLVAFLAFGFLSHSLAQENLYYQKANDPVKVSVTASTTLSICAEDPAAIGVENGQVAVQYRLKRNGGVIGFIVGTGTQYQSFGTFSTPGLYTIEKNDGGGWLQIPAPLQLENFFVLPDTTRIAHSGNPADPKYFEHYICEWYTNPIYTVDSAAINTTLINAGCGGIAPQGITWITTGWDSACNTFNLSTTGQGSRQIKIFWFEAVRGRVRAQIETTEGCIFYTQWKYVYIFLEPHVGGTPVLIDPVSQDTLPDTIYYCGDEPASTRTVALSESERYEVCVPPGAGFPAPLDPLDGYWYYLFEFGQQVDSVIPDFNGEQIQFEIGSQNFDTVFYSIFAYPIHHDDGLGLTQQPLPYCGEFITNITVIRSFDPVADAGPDQVVCADACTTLEGMTGVPEPFRADNFDYWWTYSGPGTLTFTPDANDSTAVVCREECSPDSSPFGLYQLWFNVENGECFDSDVMDLTYLEEPVAAVADDDLSLCDENCFTIEALPYSYCGLYNQSWNADGSHWEFVSGPQAVSFGDPSLFEQGICLDDQQCFYGIYHFQWVEVNQLPGTVTACTDTIDVYVTIYEPPVDVDAGADDALCQVDGSSYTLMGTGHTYCTADGSTDVSYMWTQLSTNPCEVEFADDASLVTDVTFSGECCFGVFGFVLTETNGDCMEDDTVYVSRFEEPVADAGMDDSYCADPQGDFYILEATPYQYCNESSPIYEWTADAGNPCTVVFADDASATTDVFFSAEGGLCCPYGVYTFYFTETNGECSDTDEVVITRFEPPTEGEVIAGDDEAICDEDCYTLAATVDATYCQDAESLDISYLWTIDGFVNPGPVTFGDPSNPMTDVCFDAAECAYGPYTFRFVEMNGDCETWDDVTITRYEQPIADAGPDFCECVDYATSYLYSTVQLAADPFDFCYTYDNCSQWSKSDGPGPVVFDDITAPDANVTFSVFGCYTFTWTECNPACEDSDDMVVCWLENPIAATELEVDTADCGTMCYDLTNIGILKYQYAPAPNVSWDNAMWTQVGGPGTATFADPSDHMSNVCVDAYGEYTFRWTEQNASPYAPCDDAACEDFVEVTIHFYEDPVANAGVGGEICGTCFTLEAIPYMYAPAPNETADNQTAYWEIVDGGACATLADDQSPTTELCISNCDQCYTTYTLVWHEENGNCEDTDTVYVTFGELPPPTPLVVFGDDQNNCGYGLMNLARDYVQECMMPGDTIEVCAFTCFNFEVPWGQLQDCPSTYPDDCGTQLPWLREGWTYEWSVIGPNGTTFEPTPGYYDPNSGWNYPFLNVCWGECCEIGTIYLTITTPFCTVTYPYYFQINHLPDATITGPDVAEVSTEYAYSVPASDCYLYNWDVEFCGEIVSGQGTNEIIVHWTDYAENGGLGIINVQILDTCTGCCGEGEFLVDVFPTGSFGDGTLFGHVTYDNSAQTPLNGVHLMLYNGDVMVAETWSYNDVDGGNGPGYFEFAGINEVTMFNLMAAYDAPWGGANATDALAIQLKVINQEPIVWDALNTEAGDVNASGGLTSTDALWVMQRAIYMVNMFPAGDWVFGDATMTDMMVQAGNFDVAALNYGDVNRSNVPSGMKESTAITLVEDGVLNVEKGEEFELPIRVADAIELGAVTMHMSVNSDLIEIVDVTSFEGALRSTVDNRVSVAWSSTNAINLANDDAVITVRAIARDDISSDDELFSVELGTEFAYANAAVVEGLTLKTFGVTTEVAPNEYALGYNRPNPFSSNTEISYALPEAGKVRLTVMNVYGTEIATIVNDVTQTPGSYTVTFSSSGLNAGVYLYRLTVDGASSDFVETRRMVISH